MNLYYGNLDFPGNNIVVWRPTAEGGRWRWISKDTDFGLGLYGRSANYNTIEWIYNHNYDPSNNWANTSEATQLFRSLMDDNDFKREFIDHAAIYMGDFLNSRGTRAVWDPMADLAKPELIKHREANSGGGWWGWHPDYEQEINNEINNVRNWLNQRTNNFYTHVANYYALGAPTPLVINKDMTEEVTTIINGVTIRNADFDGKFFANRQLTVEGKGAEGREVTGWKVVKTLVNNSTTTSEVYEPVYTFPMPACKKLELTAIMGASNGISTLAAQDWTWRIDGRQLIVSGVNSGTNVMLYDVCGMLLSKVRGNGADIRIPLTSDNRLYVLKVGAETVKIK